MLPQGWREEALHSPEQNAPGTWKPGSAIKQNMSPGSWRANGIKLLPEDSKGFDKHKTLNSRDANSSKGSEADRGHRMPAEPDELAQPLPGAKDEPREIRNSIRGGKEHPLLLFYSPDVSVTGSALCKVLTSWSSL